jgi:hypothetical protein
MGDLLTPQPVVGVGAIFIGTSLLSRETIMGSVGKAKYRKSANFFKEMISK